MSARQLGLGCATEQDRCAKTFDLERIRADFPILQTPVHGKPLVYLDNAASSQMPQPVIDRLVHYQTTQHANITAACTRCRNWRPSSTRQRGASCKAS